MGFVLRLLVYGVFVISTAVFRVHSYRRVDVRERVKSYTGTHFRHDKRTARSIVEQDIHISRNDLLLLQPGEELKLQTAQYAVQGVRFEKYQELYQDIPVFEGIVTVEVDRDSKLTGDASGTLIQDIYADINDLKPRLSKERVLEILIREESDNNRRDDVEVQAMDEWIYPGKDGIARLTFYVQYLIDTFPPKRPTAIIDAISGDIILRYNAIEYASCPKSAIVGTGGNMKSGETEYGQTPYCITPKQTATTCLLENEYVRVVNMISRKEESKHTQQTISFPCDEPQEDIVNGGYSPTLDLFFYGTTVAKMYEDWIGGTLLKGKIVLRAHYGLRWDNAVWNGNNCSFGDGFMSFYPLTSIDIVGHEIGHGVVERYSSAMYMSQSGGINEAFADILGLSAAVYFRGKEADVEWSIGANISRQGPFLRSFENPAADGFSINHVDNFTEDIDPHFSSGVFRLAFFNIVSKYNVTVKNAFKAFDRANKLYWHHLSTFQHAGCGVMKAAYDLGQDTKPYKIGFKEVGVTGCNINDHVRNLVNRRKYQGIVLSNNSHPLFKFETPVWADNVTVVTESLANDKDIEIEVCSPSLASNDVDDDCRIGINSIEFTVNGTSVTYITLAPVSMELVEVALTAYYTCNPHYKPSDELPYYLYMYENCLYYYYCDRDRYYNTLECQN